VPPQPTQFLSRCAHCVIDGVGLGEFLVERMFATGRQRQRNRSVSSEVADEFEVIVTEWRLLRVACNGDHAKHPVVAYQRHHDRRAFTDIGEPLDRMLERARDQRSPRRQRRRWWSRPSGPGGRSPPRRIVRCRGHDQRVDLIGGQIGLAGVSKIACSASAIPVPG